MERIKRNRENSPLHEKSYKFAIRIVKLARYLQTEKKEFVISNQILRSGTSVGALIRESEFAQSKPDFINKLTISLKEANETDFWLNLLKDTEFIDNKIFDSMITDCDELIALLVSSIKTSKENNSKRNNSK
jgi:four helix bundle protein